MSEQTNQFKPIVTTNSSRWDEQGWTFSNRLTPEVPHTEIQNTAYWIDPVSGKFHKEESLENVRNDIPMITHPILNLYENEEATKLKQSGNLEGYKGNGGWTDEYYPKALLVQSETNAAKKQGHHATVFSILDGLRQSGKITSDDYANVKSSVMASKVMGISPIGHVLKQLVTVNRVNRIDQKYYKFDAPTGQVQDMGYFNLPEGVIGQYESDVSKIAPFGYTYGVTEDYYMQPYDVDPLGDLLALFASRVSLFENTKIATALNALDSDTGGASFTALTGEHFTNNAYDIIFAKIAAIGGLERANPTTIITQRKTLVDYQRNQVSGDPRLTRGVTGPAGMFAGIANGIANLEGMTWGYDSLITLNDMIIADPSWMIWNEGPQRMSSVINNLTQVKQTLFKKWGGFKIVTFGITAAGSQESFRKIDTLA